MTFRHQQYDTAVDRIIQQVGKKIVIGIPLGVGKPIGLINALYLAVERDANLSLTILTALTLGRPSLKNPLEKRLAEPILDRLLQDYEELLYEKARLKQQLPKNIRVIEFFLTPGKYLNNDYVQQNYISTNYSTALANFHAHGMNVVAQLVAVNETQPDVYSVSSNSDVFQDAVNEIKASGIPYLVMGEVNRHLPFMYGDAVIPQETFTDIVDTGHYRTLFALPHDEVSATDHLIGLYTSTLIKDDGCLQIGIGSLSTAVTNALMMRHQKQEDYQAILQDLAVTKKFGDMIAKIGETNVFNKGLNASTEMLGDDYINLYNAKILSKRVYDNLALQNLVNQGKLSEKITSSTLDVLLEENIISAQLTASDVAFLVHFGIFRPTVRWKENKLITEAGEMLADLSIATQKTMICDICLGDHLKQGKLVHAAFILGTQALYQQLSTMSFEEAQLFNMTTIDRTNTLNWSRDLLTAQRKNMRLINSAMMVTLGGVVVSDGLQNLREVSGVGGQFDFVQMAQDLKGARSIINCRSTRTTKNGVESNIVWEYSNITLPRFLRDIVITEYGIADCRTKTDADIIKAMLNIADSRFQANLLKQAKAHGKIERDYEIPPEYRHNFPEKILPIVNKYQAKGLFQAYPFGTELTPDEIVLANALKKAQYYNGRQQLWLALRALLNCTSDKRYQTYLTRMRLAKPQNLQEWFYKKLVKQLLCDVD